MSVFRELFVELPMAVLEAKIRQNQPSEPLPRPQLGLRSAIAVALRNQYGWIRCVMTRCPDRDGSELTALLPCRHLLRIQVDDQVFVRLLPIEAFDYVEHLIDENPRDCYCTQRNS